MKTVYENSKAYMVDVRQSNTNCLTYIPNDINLTLSNGTLTLKAGSKIYVPNGKDSNGNNVFDEVVVETDNSRTFTWVGEPTFLFYATASDTGETFEPSARWMDGTVIRNTTSATSFPSSPANYSVCYRTDENKVYRYVNSQWVHQRSLPIGIINGSNSVVTSIDQIFNGFGYIGNTLFGLPNVKGLIPNGKNSDGSNNCTETETPSVETYTYSTWTRTNQPLCLANNQLQVSNTADGRYYAYKDSSADTLTYVTYYDNNENKMYHSSATAGSYSQVQYLCFGYVTLTNGVISNMRIQSPQSETIPCYKAFNI